MVELRLIEMLVLRLFLTFVAVDEGPGSGSRVEGN